MLKGFKEFISRGNVIDLAVGVVIGAAFTAVINAVVEGVLTPFIAAIFGKPTFDNVTIQIGSSNLLIGTVLTQLVNFVLVAAALYFFVVVPMNSLARRRKSAAPEEPEEKVVTELDVLNDIKTLLEKQQSSN